MKTIEKTKSKEANEVKAVIAICHKGLSPFVRREG
jgi:hypothetical protein